MPWVCIWTDDSNNLYLAEEKERIKLILLAINTSKIIFPSQYYMYDFQNKCHKFPEFSIEELNKKNDFDLGSIQ